MSSNTCKGRCAGAIAVAVFLLIISSTVAAFAGLPSGGQINDDPAAGIDKGLSVGGEDPVNADVVDGSLSSGLPAVPWAVFVQTEAGTEHNQVFSRSFGVAPGRRVATAPSADARAQALSSAVR
jgi:hypothetical protein